MIGNQVRQLLVPALLVVMFGATARASDAVPGTRPTTSHMVLAERLSPHSKLFGHQLIKFSPNPRADIQLQFIRKNLLNVKDALGAHVEILDSWLKDPQFKPAEADRARALIDWITVFEKEKVFADAVSRFDRLYVRLRLAITARNSHTEATALLTALERDVLLFAKEEPKNPWAVFLVGLTRQFAEVLGVKGTIEKDKEFYFNQASLAAVDDAQFHFVLGQLFLEYYDRTDTSIFLKLVATEFEKCLLIDSAHNNKELWSTVTAIYVDIHEDFQPGKRDLPEPFWFEELVYKRIIKLDPTNASAHNNLSFLYSQNGVNLKEALKEAQIANQLNPNNPSLMDSLGWAYYKNKQLAQAMDVLKRASVIKSDIADVHFHLATVYFDLDDFPNASREFKETIRLDPGNAFAKNNLAYLYSERGVQLDDAIKLVDDALAKYPDNAAFIDTKGWIYFKQRKFDLAVENLRKAIELMPETSDLHLHLGTVFLTLGRYPDATQHFEKALTYDSGNPQIAKDLSYAFALHGLSNSLERFRKISGVDRNKENFKVFHDLIAQVYMQKGDYAVAQRSLEEYRVLQSKEEPPQEESGESGDDEQQPKPAHSPEPVAPAPAPLESAPATPRTTAYTLGPLTPASMMAADTDVLVTFERNLIARLLDLAIERARAAGNRIVLPPAGTIAAALERVSFGFTIRSIKGATRSCGLGVVQLMPTAAVALRAQLALLGEGPRTLPGPMNLKVEVTTSRYKNHVLYLLSLPQGAVYLTLAETMVAITCAKSDLVAAIDRHVDTRSSLQAVPAYKKLIDSLGGTNDLLMFCRPGPVPSAEVPVPAPIALILAKCDALLSSWTVGTNDGVDEQTIVLPAVGATTDELKPLFEAAAKSLDETLRGRTGGKSTLQATYSPDGDMLRGLVKVSGASTLATELYQVLRKQMGGDIPGLK